MIVLINGPFEIDTVRRTLRQIAEKIARHLPA